MRLKFSSLQVSTHHQEEMRRIHNSIHPHPYLRYILLLVSFLPIYVKRLEAQICEISEEEIADYQNAYSNCNEREKLLFNHAAQLYTQKHYALALRVFYYLVESLEFTHAAPSIIKSQLALGIPLNLPDIELDDEMKAEIFSDVLSNKGPEEELLKQILETWQPKKPKDFKILARYYFKLKDYAKSLEMYAPACKTANCSAEDMLSYAICFERTEQFTQGYEVIQGLLKSRLTEFSDPKLLVNHLLFTALKLDKASEAVSELKKIDTKLMDLVEEDLFNSYLLWLYQNDKKAFLTDAEIFLEKPYSFNEDSAKRRTKLHTLCGFIQQKEGSYDQAIKHLKQAVSLNSHDHEPAYYLAFAYYKSGDYKLAKQFVEKALAIKIDYQEAKDLRKYLENR